MIIASDPIPVNVVQLQFSIDDLSRGEAIVDSLLQRRLVACAQTIGAVRSRYWWQGSLEAADEWLILCKTTSEHLGDAIEHIRAAHPYEVPEIIASDVTGGNGPYLAWVDAETRG